MSTSTRSGELLEEHRVNSVLGLGWDSSGPAQGLRGVPGPCPWAEEPWDGSHGSLSLLGRRSCRSCSAINRPSAEITVQPLPRGQGTPSPSVAISVQKRLCRSSTDLSGRSVPPSPCVLVGTSKGSLQHAVLPCVASLIPASLTSATLASFVDRHRAWVCGVFKENLLAKLFKLL